MRKLGIVGGMSWVATGVYFDRINRLVQKDLGPRSNPPMLVESIDFAQFGDWLSARDWNLAASHLIDSAKRLEAAGADGLLIAANTMHKVLDEVAASISIPIIDVVEAVGERVSTSKFEKFVLIGTRTVMTDDFVRDRLIAKGVELLPPEDDNVAVIERIIYDELMVGKATRDAERKLRSIMTERAQDGAEAVILMCTEMEAVVDTDANVLPIFNSTDIHCEAAAEWILGKQ